MSVNAGEENGIKETVRRFILSSINFTDLDDDDNLFESGIVNSLFAVQLMTFIERTFCHRSWNGRFGHREFQVA